MECPLLLPGQKCPKTGLKCQTVNNFKQTLSCIPRIGDTIVGTKVIRLSAKYAVLEWLHRGKTGCTYRGTLRLQDIWLDEDGNRKPSSEAYITQWVKIGQLLSVKIIGEGDFSTGFILCYKSFLFSQQQGQDHQQQESSMQVE